MPRANRHFLPGQLWHITHGCHEKTFLFKFARDRRRYLRWLFEAKKRFRLCVLNYVVSIVISMKQMGRACCISREVLIRAFLAPKIAF